MIYLFLKANGLSNDRYGLGDLGYENYPNREDGMKGAVFSELEQG